MEAADCVRNYKALANVERAFRSLKTVDLKVRPIHHRTADRVRAHILLCMLACYVERHMREAWAPLHSFSTLMADLATIARNTCRTPSAGAEAPTFDIVTTPYAKQQHALGLIQRIRV